MDDDSVSDHGMDGLQRRPRSEHSVSTSSYGEIIVSHILDDGHGGPFTASPLALASNLAPRSSNMSIRSQAEQSVSTVSTSANGGSQRALKDIRDQVANQIAVRAISKAETIDGCKIGVASTMSSATDVFILRSISEGIEHNFVLRTVPYLFAISLAGNLSDPGTEMPLLLCSSTPEILQRAALLVNGKFTGRIVPGAQMAPNGRRWFACIRALGTSPFDEDALWDVLRKAARVLMDPLMPPPGSMGIDQRLELERARLERITPKVAYEQLREPTSPWPVVLVDIRPEAQRREEGSIRGAMVIERNVLEWRFDPRSSARVPVADRYDLRVIVFCSEGYTSSLAAASLRDLGLLSATDIIGGYKAWKAAGLPAEVEILATGLPVPEEYSFS